jgi:hypothetical protein
VRDSFDREPREKHEPGTLLSKRGVTVIVFHRPLVLMRNDVVVTGRFGEVVEHMIVPNLAAKFRELGFEFTKASQNVKIADREHDIHAEIDAFLENGDKAMIVEIKTKPSVDDVKDHVEKMGKLRRYADLKGDSRTWLGAIAGVVISDSVSTYILKNGFYVIEPAGDTFNIIEPKGKYKAREW